MKNKGSLMLMELLIMILVFALAAALCLQLFVRANILSARTARTEDAFLLAANAAEVLKATGGDFERAGNLSPGVLRLELLDRSGEIPGLGQAEIRVYFEEELLISLDTGWQEVIP